MKKIIIGILVIIILVSLFFNLKYNKEIEDLKNTGFSAECWGDCNYCDNIEEMCPQNFPIICEDSCYCEDNKKICNWD